MKPKDLIVSPRKSSITMRQRDMVKRDCEHGGQVLPKFNGNKTCYDLTGETYCECGVRLRLQISQVTRHHNLCLVSVNG